MVVKINDTNEFLTSISSGQLLMLKGIEYPISDYVFEQYSTDVYYKDTYDGRELYLENICNLEINGFDGAHIHISPRYSYVMCYKECNDIKIRNTKFGHQPESGGCNGGVLFFENCQNILLDSLELYGCGRVGISLIKCKNITIKNSIIRNCTEGILELDDCENILFVNCTFIDNLTSTISVGHCNNVIFSMCNFQNNRAGWSGLDHIINVYNSSYDISEIGCTYYGNDAVKASNIVNNM